MTNLYKKFVAGRTGEILTHVPSYEDLTPDDRATIEQADLIVEQLFDLKPQADIAGIGAGKPRLFIPMVTAGFLWPFAGQAHPKNVDYPFLSGGPYGGEASDSYLNRLIFSGMVRTRQLKPICSWTFEKKSISIVCMNSSWTASDRGMRQQVTRLPMSSIGILKPSRCF